MMCYVASRDPCELIVGRSVMSSFTIFTDLFDVAFAFTTAGKVPLLYRFMTTVSSADTLCTEFAATVT